MNGRSPDMHSFPPATTWWAVGGPGCIQAPSTPLMAGPGRSTSTTKGLAQTRHTTASFCGEEKDRRGSDRKDELETVALCVRKVANYTLMVTEARVRKEADKAPRSPSN